MLRLIDADELPIRSIDATDLPKDKGLLVVLKEDIDNAPTVRLEYLPNYAGLESVEMVRASRPQGDLIKPLTELCDRYCKFCPITGTPDGNDCTDCICTHIRRIIERSKEE